MNHPRSTRNFEEEPQATQESGEASTKEECVEVLLGEVAGREVGRREGEDFILVIIPLDDSNVWKKYNRVSICVEITIGAF